MDIRALGEMQTTDPAVPAAPRASHQPLPAVFLGAFASEVNEPDVLAASFADLADVTELVVAAVRNGVLSEREGAEHLRALRLTDANGTLWTVGATSLRWYRKATGRSWKLAVPPEGSDSQCDESSAFALTSVPPEVLRRIGARVPVEQGPAALYGNSASAQAELPAPAPWEYEMGDARQRSAASGVVAPPSLPLLPTLPPLPPLSL
jgi:hypothetical protein